jgi:hypothetical protein
MKAFRKALFISAGLAMGLAGSHTLAADAAQPAASTYRDGSHDFDFNIGTWRTHIKTLEHPLSGSSAWEEMTGTVTVRKIWGGKASMEEIEADGKDGHFEGMTLFLYNPQSHQWSQSYANSSNGTIEESSVGEFKDGRGELIAQEPYNGRTVLVRTVWSEIQPNSHRFEQSFSDDNGKTWEPNFVADLTRISP